MKLCINRWRSDIGSPISSVIRPDWPLPCLSNRSSGLAALLETGDPIVIRKLPSGQYRLYSRRKDPKTGKRRNLGTFPTRAAAEQHERAIQFFKRRG